MVEILKSTLHNRRKEQAMSKLFFQNNGAFDPRAMTTFGVSVKETENPVGYFGTGFKYAVAIILRLGGSITVGTKAESGEFQIYKFSKVSETIRGTEIDIVYMNDQSAGFTTRLGINWKPWQAYRELLCNAMDEGGAVGDEFGEFDTTVTVDCPEIFDAWINRDKYFIEGKADIEDVYCDIFKRPSNYLYYQGVAVADAPDGALFSYNIKTKIALTEDRTAANRDSMINLIVWALTECTDEAALHAVLGCKDSFEGRFSFPDYRTPSEAFLKVCDDRIRTGRPLNKSASELFKKTKHRKDDYEPRTLTETEQRMMERACDVLASIGITVKDYEICTVLDLGENVMGRALNGKIYLSELPFQMGTKQVASTLMEEWVHLRHECADFSRKMQNWLFDKILSLTEERTGEPL
jgi:hypothetical protein